MLLNLNLVSIFLLQFHYFSKYATPTLPPCWMVSEVISLGRWSYVFSCIKNREDQKAISRVFGVHYRILDSWMQSIVYLRNLCAHHNRIWNRIFVISPKKMKSLEQYLDCNTSFAAQATILIYGHILNRVGICEIQV